MSAKPRAPVHIGGSTATGQAGQIAAGEGTETIVVTDEVARDITQSREHRTQFDANRRKPETKCTEAQFRSVRAAGMSVREQCNALGITRSTWYCYDRKWPGKI